MGRQIRKLRRRALVGYPLRSDNMIAGCIDQLVPTETVLINGVPCFARVEINGKPYSVRRKA